MKEYRVYKTLVVGLGSTGTRILNALAERIAWEVGGIHRVPWVRFLALETDPSQGHSLSLDDFRPLKIDGPQYSQILENPEAYDESIALTRWADLETLRKLPSGAIQEGAGHIRMVGRLALLYPSNFRMVRTALEQRLNALRQLSVAEAERILNEGVTHQQRFEVALAETDALRIFVVGTLAGGTCSGTAGDMGILLRTLTQKESERIFGIFTLPHPQHNNAVAGAKGLAEEHKANAYHALVELNHYQNTDDEDRFKGIRYPDYPQGQDVLSPSQLPYDVIYLVRPRRNDYEEQERLVQVVADRIFLNVFVPETDPMREIVNGGIVPPRQGLTFNFASFGLASVEYPVRRVVEAAKSKLMAEAIRSWKSRSVDLDITDLVQNELGLVPNTLLNDLLTDEGGGSVRQDLKRLREEIRRLAREGGDKAERVLREWRSTFERPGEGTKGRVSRTVSENRSLVPRRLLQRFMAQAQRFMADYYMGPAPLEKLLEESRQQLSALRQWKPRAVRTEEVDRILQQIRLWGTNPLLRFFLLHKRAVGRLIPHLDRALEEEERARLEHKLYEVFQDGPSGRYAEPGVLSLLEDELEKVARRFRHLRQRLDRYHQELNQLYLTLDSQVGAVNGLALYRPGPDGTLDAELDRLLDGRAKEDLLRRLIGTWADLYQSLFPSGEQDWLRDPPSPAEPSMPQAWTRRMEEEALNALIPLRNSEKSLEERLLAMASPSFDPEKEVESAAQKANLFLPVDEALGRRTPDSPVMPRKMLLGPVGERMGRALQFWRNSLPPATEVPTRDPFRLVLLEEKHKFSLRGAAEIINVLGAARASSFPTYFTRRRLDVDWTPLSDKERQSLEEAERRLLVALLHGVVRLEGGYLVLDWPETLGITETRRYLPNTLARASRLLAFSRKDAKELPIPDALAVLKGRVDQEVARMLAELGPRQYILHMKRAIGEGSFRSLKDWNTAKAIRAFTAWHRENPNVLRAILEVFPPDQAMLNRLFKHRGDERPKGGLFERDGYYCVVCGGPVGETLEEATARSFRCDYYPDDPDHPFGEPYSVFHGLEGA